MYSMEILFRVSTDPKYGSGHLKRMLAYDLVLRAQSDGLLIQSKNSELTYSIPQTDNIQEEEAISSVEKLLSFAKQNKSRTIICDSYNISWTALKQETIRVVYFSDVDVPALSRKYYYCELPTQAATCD